jgi:hypothetical protein
MADGYRSAWQPMQQTMKLVIPLILQKNRLEAEEAESKRYWDERKAELVQKAREAEIKAGTEMVIGQYENAMETGNRPSVEAFAPMLEQRGLQVPKTFEQTGETGLPGVQPGFPTPTFESQYFVPEVQQTSDRAVKPYIGPDGDIKFLPNNVIPPEGYKPYSKDTSRATYGQIQEDENGQYQMTSDGKKVYVLKTSKEARPTVKQIADTENLITKGIEEGEEGIQEKLAGDVLMFNKWSDQPYMYFPDEVVKKHWYGDKTTKSYKKVKLPKIEDKQGRMVQITAKDVYEATQDERSPFYGMNLMEVVELLKEQYGQ